MQNEKVKGKRMPRRKQKEETLVHLDLETLSQREIQKNKTDDKSEPKTLGEILSQARERKKMTLESVSKKLCIKAVYLNALEKGHYYAFPALAYGLGFLRTYATFLGLNPSEMIEMFHKESAYIKSEPLEMPVVEHKKMMPSWKTALKMTVLFIIVAGGWYVAGNIGSEFDSPFIMTDPESQVEVLEEPVATEPISDAQPSEELPTLQEQALLQAESTTVVEQPSGEVYGLKTPARLSFLATADVWIEVTDKQEKVVFNKILRKGDIYNPPAESSALRLRMANAGALTLYIDGAEIRSMGARGEVKSHVSLDVNELLNSAEK